MAFHCRPSVLLILTLLLSLFSRESRAQHYTYRQYTTEDGLPSDVVYDFREDDQGYLWVGTSNGMAKFDGYSFTSYDTDDGLADIEALVLRKDRIGRIWAVGNSKKLSIIEKGKIRPFEYNHIIEENSELTCRAIDFYVDSALTCHYSSNFCGVISIRRNGEYKISAEVDEENFWYLEEKEPGVLFKYQKKTFKKKAIINYPMHYKINDKWNQFSTLFSHWGRADAVLIESGLYAINNAKDTIHLISPEGIKPFFGVKGIINSINYINGEVWVGTTSGLEIQKIRAGLTPGKKQRLFGELAITRTYQDRRGGVWMGTLNHGLFYFPNLSSLSFSGLDGLPFDVISAVTSDKNGNIFIGGENGEIALIRSNGKIKYYSEYPNKIRRVRSFFWSGDEKLFFDAYSDYVFTFDENLQIKSIARDYLTSGWLKKDFYDFKGTIYMGGAGGLNRIRGDTIESVPSPVTRNLYSNTICPKNDSVFYLGSLDGLYEFNIRTGEVYYLFKDKPIFNVRINRMKKIGSKNFAIATDGRGIIILSGDSVIVLDRDAGLASDFYHTLTIHKNEIWGVHKKGISRIKVKGLDPPEFDINGYDFKDGLGSGRYMDVIVNDSIALFASSTGLKQFYYTLHDEESQPPKVILDRVLINDSELEGEIEKNKVTDPKTVEFFFTGLNFVSNGDILYRYRLKGFDEGWSFTRGRQIRYNSLPSGNYQFEVAARDHKGNWSAEEASFALQILPPFWRTWWFFSLEAIAAIILIFSFINWRLNYLKTVTLKKEMEEKEKAQLELEALRHQMNPHFLFNTLNSIQSFISTRQKDEAVRYLSRFSRLIRRNLEHSRDTSISLKEEIDSLQVYLDLERMRFDNAFEYEIGLDGIRNPDRIHLPSLIIQPYVENAVLHGMQDLGRPGLIKINFSLDRNELKCVVEDNGVGRDKKAIMDGRKREGHKSVGMTITQRRLKLLNNKILDPKIEIEDLQKNGKSMGTRVEIGFPVSVQT